MTRARFGRPPRSGGLVILAVLAGPLLGGCSKSTVPSPRVHRLPAAYRYDVGPGRIGDTVDLAAAGRGDATAAAKRGRRTYEVTTAGSTSRFTIAPTKFLVAVQHAKAATSTIAGVTCPRLGDRLARSIAAATRATTALVDDGLPGPDRSFALLQHLAPDQYRMQRSVGALNCSADQVSAAAAGALDRSTTRSVAAMLGTSSGFDAVLFAHGLLTG